VGIGRGVKTEEGRERRDQTANLEKRGVGKWVLPVFLLLLAQKYYLRGKDRRARWYLCDRTSVRF
jgi:hypothetical protein